MSVYRNAEYVEPAPVKLRWWKRRPWPLFLQIVGATPVLSGLACLVLYGGCRNEAISYAKSLDQRVKCSAVGRSWGPGPDKAVCYLRLGSGKVEVWSCTEESEVDAYAGFPRCIVQAVYDAERK